MNLDIFAVTYRTSPGEFMENKLNFRCLQYYIFIIICIGHFICLAVFGSILIAFIF